VKQRFLVVLIHMLDYPLLGFAKGILDEHRTRLDPEYLSKPADKARSPQKNSIEREIMCPEVGFCRRKTSQVAIAYRSIVWIDCLGVSYPGEASVRLRVINALIEDCQ